MPKGIRKACANCIKARLACDDGRPCQRCVVHQCECVAVPRKPRVKRQKVESPPLLVSDSENSVISWVPTDVSTFTDVKDSIMPQISSPQLSPALPQSPPQTPIAQLQKSPQPSTPPPQPFPASENPLSPTQMMSMIMEDKSSSLLQEWPETTTFGNYINDFLFSMDDTCLKKPVNITTPLPQPKNAIPLHPAPIGIFDKEKFMLLDANAALATLYGSLSVADMANSVSTLDDLVDPATAQIAKNAYSYFLSTSTPFDRLGVVRTHSGGSKTVEFRAELTEQLLIVTIKSVYDECFMTPEMPVQLPSAPSLSGKPENSLQYKAFEFLSPID